MDDTQLKMDAQLQYCTNNKVPYFAPMSGMCYSCRRNIWTHITIEKASGELITGCPLCNYSYCE